MPYTYEYPRPSVTVDCVVFGVGDDGPKVLLIERQKEPFAGCWAIPGGFVELDESLDAAAQRELCEETGVRVADVKQLYTFGAVDRDPRGRVISVAYWSVVRLDAVQPRAGDDARRAEWFNPYQPPPLAFDHAEILEMALHQYEATLRSMSPNGR